MYWLPRAESQSWRNWRIPFLPLFYVLLANASKSNSRVVTLTVDRAHAPPLKSLLSVRFSTDLFCACQDLSVFAAILFACIFHAVSRGYISHFPVEKIVYVYIDAVRNSSSSSSLSRCCSKTTVSRIHHAAGRESQRFCVKN